MYGAIYISRTQVVRVYLPRSFNLSDAIRRSKFYINGTISKVLKWKTLRRYEVIELSTLENSPEQLQLHSPDFGIKSTKILDQDRTFEKRRVIYTLLRNEKLEWISDWIKFHVQEHGADAVIIADNGSTTHSCKELSDTISSISDIAAGGVFSVPLPWGHNHRAHRADDAEFLQSAMLNFVRDAFLSQSSSVLCADVDELVVAKDETSVFDAARPWGYATFPGVWYYPARNRTSARHLDHFFYNPNDKACPHKYVYNPKSLLGQQSLAVHSLEKLNRRLLCVGSRFHFVHCRAISRSWKFDRLDWDDRDLIEDIDLRTKLLRTFSEPTVHDSERH